MKRIKSVTLTDWLESLADAEDMAIRKREGLPLTSTGYAYHGRHAANGNRPESDIARAIRALADRRPVKGARID